MDKKRRWAVGMPVLRAYGHAQPFLPCLLNQFFHSALPAKKPVAAFFGIQFKPLKITEAVKENPGYLARETNLILLVDRRRFWMNDPFVWQPVVPIGGRLDPCGVAAQSGYFVSKQFKPALKHRMPAVMQRDILEDIPENRQLYFFFYQHPFFRAHRDIDLESPQHFSPGGCAFLASGGASEDLQAGSPVQLPHIIGDLVHEDAVKAALFDSIRQRDRYQADKIQSVPAPCRQRDKGHPAGDATNGIRSND